MRHLFGLATTDRAAARGVALDATASRARHPPPRAAGVLTYMMTQSVAQSVLVGLAPACGALLSLDKLVGR